MQEVSAMILSDGLGYDGATFVPIVTELGSGRLVSRTQNPVSLVELGKKLLIVAKNGETEEVRELMSKGAPFTTDWLGTSPLHFAALNNHVETCEVLLRAGISRDARTKVDRTPLHMAAYEGHYSIVDVLILSGADVDAKDMLKMTPLHWAVQNEHLDVISLLIRHGANPDIINKFEKTPADIAVDLNRMDILQKLQFVTKDPLVMNEDLDESHEIHQEEQETTNQEKFMETETLQIEQEVLQEKEAVVAEPQISSNIKYTNVNSFINITKHLGSTANLQESFDMSDSLNILKEHGISFLPNDESSIVASAVENGHSLVLTEVGKQVLNSTKPYVKLPVQKTTIPNKIKGRKVVTLSAQQLLAMVGQKNGIIKKLPTGVVNLSDKIVKKPIVMNKNKIIIGGLQTKIQKKPEPVSEIEVIKQQLAEARKEIEEYKQMFKSKEAEAERYKRQLLSLTQNKIIINQ